MIEESGENWFYEAELDRPSIDVLVTRTSVERTITRKQKAKPNDRKRRKPQPFGFARVLHEPKKGKRGRS